MFNPADPQYNVGACCCASTHFTKHLSLFVKLGISYMSSLSWSAHNLQHILHIMLFFMRAALTGCQ